MDIIGESIQGLIFSSFWLFIMLYSFKLCLLAPKIRKVTEPVDPNEYNANLSGRNLLDSPGSDNVPFHKLHKFTEDSENTTERLAGQHESEASSPLRSLLSNWKRSMKMTVRSTSLPSCFYILFYSSTIHEMILISFPMTMNLHFGWNSRTGGLFVTLLYLVIIPTTIFTQKWIEGSTDRVLLKVSDCSSDPKKFIYISLGIACRSVYFRRYF
jgi:hypothetical protein